MIDGNITEICLWLSKVTNFKGKNNSFGSKRPHFLKCAFIYCQLLSFIVTAEELRFRIAQVMQVSGVVFFFLTVFSENIGKITLNVDLLNNFVSLFGG